MRKLLASLVFVVMVALLATAVMAQAVVDPPLGPNSNQYLLEVDDPVPRRFQLKYPYQTGPDEPENPWVIQEPLYPERQRGNNINTSIASSQGLNPGGYVIAPTAMAGPGAVLSAPRASGSARSSHQDARRGLKKVIRQLG